MSNIPLARELLFEALEERRDERVRDLINQALEEMFREKPVRFAPSKRVAITGSVRREIERLARTKLTMVEIARMTGVRNQGRVSEVLNGKR